MRDLPHKQPRITKGHVACHIGTQKACVQLGQLSICKPYLSLEPFMVQLCNQPTDFDMEGTRELQGVGRNSMRQMEASPSPDGHEEASGSYTLDRAGKTAQRAFFVPYGSKSCDPQVPT